MTHKFLIGSICDFACNRSTRPHRTYCNYQCSQRMSKCQKPSTAPSSRSSHTDCLAQASGPFHMQCTPVTHHRSDPQPSTQVPTNSLSIPEDTLNNHSLVGRTRPNSSTSSRPGPFFRKYGQLCTSHKVSSLSRTRNLQYTANTHYLMRSCQQGTIHM